MTTWLKLYCELCGKMGAAVENRVVGDVMVDENGHKWISPVRHGPVDSSLKWWQRP